MTRPTTGRITPAQAAQLLVQRQAMALLRHTLERIDDVPMRSFASRLTEEFPR